MTFLLVMEMTSSYPSTSDHLVRMVPFASQDFLASLENIFLDRNDSRGDPISAENMRNEQIAQKPTGEEHKSVCSKREDDSAHVDEQDDVDGIPFGQANEGNDDDDIDGVPFGS